MSNTNREAFEAWYKNNFGEPDFLRGACGTYYMNSSVDFAWQTWQAALAQANVNEQSQAQQTESQWSPIDTAPKNKKIIVRYKNVLGKDRTVFAKYLEKFTEEASEGTDCETDYCEDDDTFYCKEGWVELIDNWDDFSSVYFDSRNVPTHWMFIPLAPEGGK